VRQAWHARRSLRHLHWKPQFWLGQVNGRIDHLTVDLSRLRLYIAELGNDSIGVVDLKSAALL
jgi:hypothetical protein